MMDGKMMSGRWFFTGSMLMALASLAVAPLIFGVLGILMGMSAVAKGERYLGMLGVTGYYVAGALAG